jgi:serine/threonine protein kinase
MQNAIEKQMRYKKTKIILGEGTYKTVTKAINEEEGKEVAYNEVKIKNYEIETKTIASFSKEISLLKNINHPNIIKILDYWFFEDNFIFITELMTGGSLNEYIEKNGPLGLKLIKKWSKQILDGLVYLHTQDPPIIHRDIKNDNIFVNTASGDVKIGDLGLAKERRNKRYTIVGTPHFMAREMFEGEGYTEKVDVYAFGMSLIEMATGKRPYTEFSDTKDIYKNVLQGVFPKILNLVSDPCLKSLIISCLVPIDYRFTSSQCLDHHFFHLDVKCKGDCVPKESVAVYPLLFDPVKDMELSIVSIFENTVTFQILLFETMKFIKFEYDLKVDTLEKLVDELISEKIIEKESIEYFSNLLKIGLITVESKIKIGKAHDGIIELNSLEVNNLKKRDIIIYNEKFNKMPEVDEEVDMAELNELQRKENEINLIKKRNENETAVNAEIERLIEQSKLEQLEKNNSESSSDLQLGTATLEEIAIIEEAMKIHEIKKELEKRKEEEISFKLKSKLLQKDASYEPHRKSEAELARINSDEKTQSGFDNSDDSFICEMDISKSLKFKNVAKEVPEIPQENVYLQFPNVDNHDLEIPAEYSYNSTSSMPQQLTDTFAKFEAKMNMEQSLANVDKNQVNVDKNIDKNQVNADKNAEKSTSIDKGAQSPLLDDLNDISLYENLKLKYKNNHPISVFIADVAASTERSEETAKSWIKSLKEEDIESVFDLKLILYEDWEKLPLTVFSGRAMQNILYGIDGIPSKEKQLPINLKLKDFKNKMKIKDFLIEICENINRSELVSKWEDRLLAEDIQTVGELKSLHQDDWNRLGLTVFGHRILKNVIQRKGKIILD